MGYQRYTCHKLLFVILLNVEEQNVSCIFLLGIAVDIGSPQDYILLIAKHEDDAIGV